MRGLMESLHFHPDKIVKLGEKSRGQIFAVGTFVANQPYECVQIFIIWVPSIRSELQKGAKSAESFRNHATKKCDCFMIDFFLILYYLKPLL